MRKGIAATLALMLCLVLACPVFAAQEDFVPSITYKGEPEIVPVKDPDGDDAIGTVYHEADKDDVISYFYDDCLIITSVAEAKSSDLIPDEAAKLLLDVYDGLVSGDMKLPYNKVNCKPEDMVILELLDITWLCGGPQADHDHPTEVEPEGVVFDITFDLGVDAVTKVVVMSYNDGQWNPIEAVKNNGDGTVTCTFEHLCPVVFCVQENYNETPPQTGDATNVWLWGGIMAVALAGIVVVAVISLRKKRK